MALGLVLGSCSEKESAAPQGNAVYFWRNSFELSDAERQFISDNELKAIYVKFFDVVEKRGELKPQSTLLFKDSLPPDIEIIPTVFIEPKAFKEAYIPPEFGRMVISRIDSMMVKNGYAISKEIQIDFDWTESNRRIYFSLLQGMADMLHMRGRRLSTTIRLHQLNQTPPPADYGVLMVYNTGAIASPKEKNSILSMESIRPYMKYLNGYALPLVTALPVYSWDLLFHDGEFQVIARGLDRNDTTLFRHVKDNLYMGRRYMPVPMSSGSGHSSAKVLPGDILRHENVSCELLDSTINILRETRRDILGRIILYHLDEKSINDYKKDDIQKIYRNASRR